MNQYKEQFKKDVSNFVSGEVTRGGKGSIVGILDEVLGGKENRYLLLQTLAGKHSSSELTEAEWYALLLLVEPYKPDGDHWQSKKGNDVLKSICDQILTAKFEEQGQLGMFDDPNPF